MNPVYITKIIRTGSSLGLVVPANILRALRMQRGDQIIFHVADGDVVCFRKITDEEKLHLKPSILID